MSDHYMYNYITFQKCTTVDDDRLVCTRYIEVNIELLYILTEKIDPHNK